MNGTDKVDEVLEQRHDTHGLYAHTARTAQRLKRVCNEAQVGKMTAEMAESLEMICTKIARVLAGNPHERDHWKDIAGYARLAELSCQDDVTPYTRRNCIPANAEDAVIVTPAPRDDEREDDNERAES